VGYREHVRIGVDPWIWSKNMVRFLEAMTKILHERGLFTRLNQVAN